MIKLIKAYFDGFKCPEDMRVKLGDSVEMTLMKMDYHRIKGIEMGFRAAFPLIVIGFIVMTVIFVRHI